MIIESLFLIYSNGVTGVADLEGEEDKYNTGDYYTQGAETRVLTVAYASVLRDIFSFARHTTLWFQKRYLAKKSDEQKKKKKSC